MKQSSLESFISSPNLKKRDENNPGKSVTTNRHARKKKNDDEHTSKNVLIDTENMNKVSQFERNDKNDDYLQMKKVRKTSRRKKKVDNNQSTLDRFCSPDVKQKKEKRDNNSNVLKPLTLEEAMEEMKKSWAKSDEQLKNLKEILELTKETEQNYFKRKEAERVEEQRRLEEIAKRKNKEIKNCTNLSLSDLEELFNRHVDWLDDIKSGRRFCRRHEMFNQGANGLLYNDSCAAFTKEQVNKIVDLLHNRYDEDDPLHLSRYYWSVLLPEFTLKIFMDIHNMNEEDALNYLKFMPDSEDDLSDFDSEDFS